MRLIYGTNGCKSSGRCQFIKLNDDRFDAHIHSKGTGNNNNNDNSHEEFSRYFLFATWEQTEPSPIKRQTNLRRMEICMFLVSNWCDTAATVHTHTHKYDSIIINPHSFSVSNRHIRHFSSLGQSGLLYFNSFFLFLFVCCWNPKNLDAVHEENESGEKTQRESRKKERERETERGVERKGKREGEERWDD